MGFAYERGLERSIQVEETAYARLRSREKLDSVPQGLKRASSKEKNGENQETSEEQRALGLLRCGDEGGSVQGRPRAQRHPWGFAGRPTLDTAAPTFLHEFSQAP